MNRRWLIILSVLLVPTQALAISAKDRHAVLFDTPYYDASDSTSGSCTGTIPSSVNLSKPIIDAINQNKSVYVEAAAQVDIPWPILPGIHLQEHGLSTTNPGNGDGVYQIVSKNYPPGKQLSHDEFLQESVDAANHLKGIAQGVYGVKLTATSAGDDVKNAILAYHRGNIYKVAGVPADRSPYVMNNFDPAHTNMVVPSLPNESLAGTHWTNPGAYTVFAALGGSGGVCGVSGNQIVDLAAAELGKGEADGSYLKYTDGIAEAWCADFISWIFNQAGQPFKGGLSGWRYPGVKDMVDYLRNPSNGTWSDRSGSAPPPQPGDIVQFYFPGSNNTTPSDHIGIVEKVEGTTLHTIEGNRGNKVDRATYDNYQANPIILGWGTKK